MNPMIDSPEVHQYAAVQPQTNHNASADNSLLN
jgi:hypothetical protein